VILSIAAIAGAGSALLLCHRVGRAASSKPISDSRRPELKYLIAVNSAAPPKDPQLLFLLMGQYASANQQGAGAEFFAARLKEFGPRLDDGQKALYLTASALLRAQNAAAVPLLRRIAYVNEMIAMFDQAVQLSGGQVFIVNYLSAIVRAQLPERFHQKQTAEQQLAWCIANADKFPDPGWLREVYYGQAKIARANGEDAKSRQFLQRSGYSDLARPISLNTPLSEEPATGHTFSARRITEPVPGRVYTISGYDFAEFYFVVTEDRRQLIAIDAGTRPDSARAAYEALHAHAPDLPPLTTVFVTHAHWDHIGGHSYFRSLSPAVRFYARSGYQEELTRAVNAPTLFAKPFFGERFHLEDVSSFRADVTIDHATEVRVGGTRIELIPVQGGETHDAMFIHLPDEGVLFLGDFIMPYLGAPFLEEGDLQGLLDAIDTAVSLHPRILLHGHQPLTQLFASLDMLAQLKTDLSWLRDQVGLAIQRGDERASIHQANLIPSALITSHPDAQLPYLLLREHVIDRLYDQKVGYWQPDLTGLDHLSRADRAEALVDYLGVSEKQLANALERLAADGRYELAASLLESTGDRFAKSEPIGKLKRLIYLKLIEKEQSLDPFKFILYCAKIGERIPPVTPPAAADPRR
jgi:glyoxylase-like metal-dependent hydrolase (beta-lactamase superfamily II)